MHFPACRAIGGHICELTAPTVRALSLPKGKKDHIVWDDLVPGFGVRLREGGSVGFVFQYALGRKQRRMAIGTLTAVSIGNARKAAEELYARVKLGQDPAGEKVSARVKAVETFGAIAGRFLAYQRARLRPRSYPDVERHLLKHSKTLHGLQLGRIERRDIATVLLMQLPRIAGARPATVCAPHCRPSLHGQCVRD